MSTKYIAALAQSNSIGIRHTEARAAVMALHALATQVEAVMMRLQQSRGLFETSVEGGPEQVYFNFAAHLARQLYLIQQALLEEIGALLPYLAHMRGETTDYFPIDYPALPDLPVAGGSAAYRLGIVDFALAALQRMEVQMLTHLEDIERQMQNPIGNLLNAWWGNDYAQMHDELAESLDANTTRMIELQIERAAIVQTLATTDVPVSSSDAVLEVPSQEGSSEVPSIPQTEPTHIIGIPEHLTSPVRRQYNHEGMETDLNGCSLFAQAAVMEAMGYDFEDELLDARKQGIEDKWYSASEGATGLGQPFAANNIPYETFGFDEKNEITAEDALTRLRNELEEGHYAVVNFDATQIAAFDNQHVEGHTVWIVGLQTDESGNPSHVIANDSHWGAIQTYPIEEFMAAWASDFKYYAVFAHPPSQ